MYVKTDLNRVYLVLSGRAVGEAHFGEGTGDIRADSVRCGGWEEEFSLCYRDRLGHDCTHSEDAGVICGKSKWQPEGGGTYPSQSHRSDCRHFPACVIDKLYMSRLFSLITVETH